MSFSVGLFRKEIWKYWEKKGRHDLPWRKTKNPYHILVAEVMLQQTQVSRVIEKYRGFLQAFPTVRALAKSPLSRVLKMWNGLGYNRRAKYLLDAAKMISSKHNGRVPRDYTSLRTLPGVGDYTARAIRVFAFDEPDVLIETNIRAAYIHYFYSSLLQKTRITDSQILLVAVKAAEGQNPRKWHSALMDYGAHIKKFYENPTRRSASYVRQSKFKGSLRQIRGAIIRELHTGKLSPEALPFRKSRIKKALTELARDGLVRKRDGQWRI